MHRRLAVLALGSLALVGAHALEPSGPLNGTWGLYSATLIDPDPREPIDRVLLTFTNDGAKAVFEAMPGKATDVDCAGDRRQDVQIKRAGDLECSLYRGKYDCSIGLLLRDGHTTKGYACD